MSQIIVKDFPDKVFATKEELWEQLRINVNKLIAVKTAEIYKSHEKGAVTGRFIDKLPDEMKRAFSMKDGFIYPVINCSNYMDSHRDVHFDDIWNKSVKDQQGKIFYCLNHDLELGKIIAWPQDVKMMIVSIPWGMLGKDYKGFTQALIYEIPKDKLDNADAVKAITDKRPVQNSVRMIYVKISLGMNSSAEEDVKYKEYYDKWIEKIVNKDKVEELGYFWGVEEARIYKEGSMVLLGSNDATPVLIPDDSSKEESTKVEPEVSTLTQPPVFDFDGIHKRIKFF
jgi:hypothetical protein